MPALYLWSSWFVTNWLYSYSYYKYIFYKIFLFAATFFFLFGLILLFHGKTSWNISLEKTNFAAECFYEYFVALFWSIQSQLPTLTANKNFSAYLDHSLSGSDCDCFNEADLDFCSVKSWAWKSTLGSEKTWTTSLAIIKNYCRRDQRLTLPILDPTKPYFS